MEAKGAGKLKVVGILFIIFGALSTILYALTLAGGGVLMGLGSSLATNYEEADKAIMGSTIIMVASGIALIWSIVQLVTGILGVKNCKVPEKAKTLFVLGIVLIIFSVVASILSIVAQGVTVVSIIGLVGGCVLPVIFMLGAKENMNAR